MSDLAERLEIFERKLAKAQVFRFALEAHAGAIIGNNDGALSPAVDRLCDDLRAAAAALRREEKPAAWAIYTPDGNIRMWTSIEEQARRKAAEWGLTVTPLYAGPPSGGAEP